MDFQRILSTSGLNTLIFTDPYAKVCVTALMVSEFERTVYLDLDSTFTAYLQSGMIKPAGRVDVFLPSEGRLVPMLKGALVIMEKSSAVIFDSVNSFYNLFHTNQKNLGSLNQLLSVVLMLLVRRGLEIGVPVLATSMLRYRQSRGWVQSPASRRLLQNKSAVKMKVETRRPGELALTVIEHNEMPAGSEFLLNDSAVTI